MENGELSPQELEAAIQKFGKGKLARHIQSKIDNDPRYKEYRDILEKLKQEGGTPGLWGRFTRTMDPDPRSPETIKADADRQLQDLMEAMSDMEYLLGDYENLARAFENAFKGKMGDLSDADLAEYFNAQSLSFTELRKELERFKWAVDKYLGDLDKSYGKDNYLLDQYNFKKGEIARMLAELMKKFGHKKQLFDAMEKLMQIKLKADAMLGGGGQGDTDETTDQGGVPQFVKDSKVTSGKKKGGRKKPKIVSESDPGTTADEKSDAGGYEIVSIHADTVEVEYDDYIYDKLRGMNAATVVIRIGGREHVIDGKKAVSILMEKGYFYYLAGVGIVSKSRRAKEQEEETAPDEGRYARRDPGRDDSSEGSRRYPQPGKKKGPDTWMAWYAAKIGFQPIFVTTQSEFKLDVPACSFPGGGLDCNVMLEKTAMTGQFATKEEAVKAACGQLSKFRHLKGVYAGMPVAEQGGRIHNIQYLGCPQECWK
jgi:hypothetical protein